MLTQRPTSRRSGQTTRRIDDYVQELFANFGGKVAIVDHYPSVEADTHLLGVLERRIRAEHGQEVTLRVSRDSGIYYAALTRLK